MRYIKEATIQVPNQLVDLCIRELKKFIDCYLTMNVPVSVYRLLSDDRYQFVKNEDSTYRIPAGSSSKIIAIPIKVPATLFQYEFDGTSLEFQFGVTNQHKRNVLGAYYPDEKMVVYNLGKSPFVEISDAVHSHFGGDFDFLSPSQRREYIRDEFSSSDITLPIDTLLRGARQTIKHELAHMIQYEFLADKDISQIENLTDRTKAASSSKRNLDKYYLSNVEFSPQIISAGEAILSFIQSHRDEDKARMTKKYLDQLVKFVVDEEDDFQLSDYLNDRTIPTSTLNRNIMSRKFFRTLKIKDYRRYKVAVKNLYRYMIDHYKETQF